MRMLLDLGRGIFMCPSLPLYKNTAQDKVILAYSQNMFIDEATNGGNGLLRLRQVPKPALFVHLGEIDSEIASAAASETRPKNLDYRHGAKKSGANGSSTAPYAYGGRTRVNLSFLDGHSQNYAWEEIYTDSATENINVMWNHEKQLTTR